MLGLTLAIAAGSSAATASSFAKLAMSPEILRRFVCHDILLSLAVSSQQPNLCSWMVISCRVLSFVLVFIFNALMWTLFVKSLRKCSSTAVATVTNTGSNLVCTAILGVTFFEESQSLRWWIGASLILMGLILIHHSSKTNNILDNTDQELSNKDKKE
ncbi:transmembrane protein 42-like [Actinia tenebrosa]|uniref:Transmembrane protein 42-like n=1 Tax=Actinia tenebrosa TaxID=6105 RepID=A0A6P8I3N4_ACTTE|nr:transmembrane protein 42-like [Actinia tenebrosa]